jgi:outer membrane receptor protein involved in Fe transport
MEMVTGKSNPARRPIKLYSLITALFVTFAIVLSTHAQAQQVITGRIMGKVLDAATGEPLIGAVVMVEGTKLGAQADLDGNYLVNNVPVGTYRLIIQSVGYAKLTVETVVVSESKATKLDFSLKTEAVVGEQVIVEATRLENTEAALLSLRQQAPSAQDAISSEAISRSGASDAAAAMSKITGASVVDGKYSVIRGMEGRYSNTQLNGSQMPSTDPDRPAVQMDLIPAGLLDNIVVQKTFTPDQQGNFSGGSVNLTTKDLPEQFTLKLSTSMSYNDNVSLKDGVLTHAGSSKEWLGFDDGFGAPPDILADSNFHTPNYTSVRNSTSAAGAHYLDQAAKDLNRDFSFSERKAPLNQGYALSFGNLYTLFGRPLGVLGSLTYNRNYSYSGDGVSRRWEVINSGGELRGLGRFQDYADERASEEVLWGGLLSANLAISPEHKLRFSFTRNQNGEKLSRKVEGYWSIATEENQRLRSKVWQYTERSMQVYQYSGDHALKLPLAKKSRFDWSASFAKNKQDDPDLRYWTDIANYDENDSLINAGIVTGFPYPTHYFRYLTEKNNEYKADLTIPVSFANEGTKIKIGGAYLGKDRHQDNWMVRLNPTQSSGLFSSYDGDPSSILTDQNLGIVDSTFDSANNRWTYHWGIVPENQSRKTDTYTGEQNISAFYGMIDWKLNSKFDLTTGARFEHTDQWVESLDSASADFHGAYKASDWLPSLNLVYHLLPNMNMRGAFSITTARPTIREMAPFYSFEFLTGNNNIGNPKLTRTLIHNWDLRWEWFTRPGEVIAVSGFYKRFHDPIERFNQSLNGDVSYLNVPEATVYGTELEFRRRLDHTGIGFLEDFQLGGNLTLVHSEVDIDPTELAYRIANGLADSSNTTRAFGGQSPFVLNADIVYSSKGGGTELALFYNIFGDRLSEVGYQSPDIFEKSRQLVDFTASQRVFGWLTAKFSAKNILNEDKYTIQEAGGREYVRSLMRVGRTFSVSMNYSL